MSNALMGTYFKCGSSYRALDVFRTMPGGPSLFCWNTVIEGLGNEQPRRGRCRRVPRHGRGCAELTAARGQAERGDVRGAPVSVQPLGAGGSGPKALRRHAAGARRAAPDRALRVNLLCRTGCVDEAARLVRTMPGPPNAKVLGSLLVDARAPERQEGSVRLSKWAARWISELDLGDGAAYGLSNVYASLQRWDRVEEHRRVVRAAARHGKGKRRKQPGLARCDLASSCTN
ncbi:pentatricopeptide repeat-containing protein At4g14050, mitochondrial-like [Panicum virgatum]|uniref:pentatricopeptide repeat-containing protein At4g14050, mitochondrial-like n=1 Tax=Panicum virgatum TaxID=38727 RepID=UPI0019D6654B|nr:pentatricopeptide repeat-containing protein At4g14050, mitochondrial-like [Panicum virgatum]